MQDMTAEEIAEILAFSPAGRTASNDLHGDEAIETRRSELAVERAANPITNESFRALLADLHR